MAAAAVRKVFFNGRKLEGREPWQNKRAAEQPEA
jgi:hypothetical protein